MSAPSMRTPPSATSKRTGMPVRFEVADGGVRIEGALIACDPASGRATAIQAVRVPWP